jgi:hypothetical protein
MSSAWPELSYEQWQATCDTLHAHTQVLGKLAAYRAPYRGRSTPVNAWWGSFDLAYAHPAPPRGHRRRDPAAGQVTQLDTSTP